MTQSQLLKDREFAEVSEVRPDAKKRVTLKKLDRLAPFYKVYSNALGQIILDPQVIIPAAELWLYKDKETLASIRRGLADAKAGRLVKLPSLAKKGKGSERAVRDPIHRGSGPAEKEAGE